MEGHCAVIEEARRIALKAQGFAEARPPGRIDRRHLRRVMNRLQLLQLDSVPVVIRTQYLPLFSRLGAYRADLLDEVAYRPAPPARGSGRVGHEWFEAWSHEASLLPVEMEPWLRWSKQRAREGATWGRLYGIAKKDPGYVDSVLAEVEARGPLAAGELSDPRPNSGDWWGAVRRARSHSIGSSGSVRWGFVDARDSSRNSICSIGSCPPRFAHARPRVSRPRWMSCSCGPHEHMVLRVRIAWSTISDCPPGPRRRDSRRLSKKEDSAPVGWKAGDRPRT